MDIDAGRVSPSHDPAGRGSKKSIRSRLRARRAQLYGDAAGAERRAREARRLLDHAAPLVAQTQQRCAADATPPLVAAFHPTPHEADVMPLARALAGLGARLIFPAAAGRELDWIAWDGRSDFVASPGRGFGQEPVGEHVGPAALSRVALVLAPAVAIDRDGTRLGHGAGYYDRALLHAPSTTPVIAVVHPEELLEAGALPRDEHDVPVDAVLTADGLVTLGHR